MLWLKWKGRRRNGLVSKTRKMKQRRMKRAVTVNKQPNTAVVGTPGIPLLSPLWLARRAMFQVKRRIWVRRGGPWESMWHLHYAMGTQWQTEWKCLLSMITIIVQSYIAAQNQIHTKTYYIKKIYIITVGEKDDCILYETTMWSHLIWEDCKHKTLLIT